MTLKYRKQIDDAIMVVKNPFWQGRVCIFVQQASLGVICVLADSESNLLEGPGSV